MFASIEKYFYNNFIMDLEIEIENNLRVKINQNDGTSSIIKSPKATGDIIVPCFAIYNNKQFSPIIMKKFQLNDIKFKIEIRITFEIQLYNFSTFSEPFIHKIYLKRYKFRTVHI